MHPVLFKLGAVSIQSYGAMVVLSLFLGGGLALISAIRTKIDVGAVLIASGLMVMGLFVGAKFGWLIEDWENARRNGVAAFLGGGLLLAPGLVLGALLVAPVPFLFKTSVGGLYDALFPPLLAAFGLGRVGCFLAGCCYGRPTDLPWAMHFQFLPPEFAGRGAHPLQLYLSAALLVSAAVFLSVLGRARFRGQIALFAVSAFAVISLGARFFRYETSPLTLAPTVIWALVFVVALMLAFVLKPQVRT